MTNHYVVLGATIADAKTHSAHDGALGVATPRTLTHAGRPITGYVMTDAFHELCEEDGPRGHAARQALRAVMIDLAHGTPHRVIRPRTLAEVTDVIGAL